MEVTAFLNPWPPEGWPEGAEGEVRAITRADPDSEALIFESVFSFPISEDGQVTYRFPEQLPRRARRFYEPVLLSEYRPCDAITPVMSPPEAEMVMLQLDVYADGARWGHAEIGSEEDLGLISKLTTVLAIAYPRPAFNLQAAGSCGSSGFLVSLNMRDGPNILQLELDENTTLHTVETLSPTQRVEKYDEE